MRHTELGAAAEPAPESSRGTKAPKNGTSAAKWFIALVLFLFFAWGFATVLIDALVPKLKAIFALNYAEAMLTQFSFFIGYFLFSLPSAWILTRLGYIRSSVVGLAVMAFGCLLFVPAAALATFSAFLFALFVMAAGITLLQVAANPFITLLGPESSASSRLTLAQAFNSLGTTVGPWFGAATILRGGVASSPDTAVVTRSLLMPFVTIAFCLAFLAWMFWLAKGRPAPAVVPQAATLGGMKRLLHRRQLMLGVVAIFTYVGAEVSIGSILISFLMQPGVLGISAIGAGQMVSLYWGGAMAGRFFGAYLLRRGQPGWILAGAAVGAALLVTMSASSSGAAAGSALVAVGLFNSIMFPTIFALATQGLGAETPNGSGLLCMAIVGGAVVPPIFGLFADRWGIPAALLLTVFCYCWIIFYGVFAVRQGHRLSQGKAVPAET